MRIRIRSRTVLGAIVLLIAAILVIKILSVLNQGRLKLPVGNGTPAICLGERHGIILASDGSLWSWGVDAFGWPALGLGTTDNKSTSLRRIGRDTDWASISAGWSFNLAIKSDGTLWTWGSGVVARGVRNPSIPSPVLAAPGNDWKQAACGAQNLAIALKKDGTLWGWGNNWGGAVGTTSATGSSVPVQIGTGTNWIKVWVSTAESVGMQSDGSLWYWGDNPNPSIAQGVQNIVVPTRVSPGTNWVDVGFGENTVFAVKSDGTLWTWGRDADAYTGATDPAQDAIPTRVGTNSDWRSFSSAPGWWITGLTKKDGSLWIMDASDGQWNGPRPPYKPVQFRRVGPRKDWVAYAGGATHAAASGYHGPIGVVLTRDGEVWTWGMVLGEPPTAKSTAETAVAKLFRLFGRKTDLPDPDPVFRDQPWQLRNLDSESGGK